MRYVIGFLLFVVAIIILLVFIFKGGGTPSPKTKPLTLTDYATSSDVLRVTIEGAQVASENHRAIRITLGNDIRQVEVFGGYNQQVLNSKVYSNDQASFNEFIRDVQLAGFTKANTSKGTTNDERGYCPTGLRYIYELDDGDQHLMRIWSDSCADSKIQTFAGNGPLIRQIFESQIPDYSQITAGVQLGATSSAALGSL